MSDVLEEFDGKKKDGKLNSYNTDGVRINNLLSIYQRQVSDIKILIAIMSFHINSQLTSTPFVLLQEIDYDGFKLFMDIFLEVDAPQQLCQHLFLSFVRIPQAGNEEEQVMNVILRRNTVFFLEFDIE